MWILRNRKAWPGVIAGWNAVPVSNCGDCWLGYHSIWQSWQLLVGMPFHSAIMAIAGWDAIPFGNHGDCWLGSHSIRQSRQLLVGKLFHSAIAS